MEEKRKQLAFAITEYLNDAIERNYVTEENKDGLEGKNFNKLKTKPNNNMFLYLFYCVFFFFF